MKLYFEEAHFSLQEFSYPKNKQFWQKVIEDFLV